MAVCHGSSRRRTAAAMVLPLLLLAASAEQLLAPQRLRVEDLEESVAVLSESVPRFSFVHPPLPVGQRGVRQASYRVTVSKVAADKSSAGTLVWDSGFVASTSTSVLYAGSALSSFTRYSWTAEWTNSAGDASAAARSSFETGPLVPSDWQGAAWIRDSSNMTQFRFTFDLPRAVVWARAYISAPGCHALEVNGQVPGTDLRGLCPLVVQSKGENSRYMTHDLTPLLGKGRNALGLLAGHVMTFTPQFVGLIMVQLEGRGAPLFFSTASPGWLQTTSYVVDDSAWATTINWTRVEAGWSTPSFVPGPQWVPATPTRYDANMLPKRALQMPLSTVVKEIKPIAVRALPGGEYLYTFPVNFVGTIKVAPLPHAASGSSLNILLGEWLEATRPIEMESWPTSGPLVTSSPPAPANLSYPAIAGDKQQYENHVLRSGNTAPIETLFCWHGFNYVLVSPAGDTTFTGQLDSIVGLEIHTNISTTGTLTFGGDGIDGSESTQAAAVLTAVDSMTRASQVSNVAAYMPTDCPTREKRGWMGDALDASEQALYNFDMAAVHRAFMQTIEDDQGPGGDVPNKIDTHKPPGNGSCNDIAWTSAYPQITNMHHIYYGDDRLARRHWSSLVRYQENLISNAKNGLATCDTYEDWLCGINATRNCCSNTGPAGSSCPVAYEVAGFNYVLGLRAMAQMAGAIGDKANATRYNHLAEVATAEFHSAFFNPSLGQYGGDDGATQSLSASALAIGSPPANVTSTVVAAVQRDLQQRAYTANVGAVTSKIILNVLSEYGLHESALRVATQTAAPSWGFWWTQGATTCWEAWPGGTSPVGMPGKGTKNHIFLCGGIGEWMWKHLVGLKPAAPAFAEVVVAPRVHPKYGPRSVTGDFLSASGAISSAWGLGPHGTKVSLNVSLPVGVRRATIVVPYPFVQNGSDYRPADAAVVTESNVTVWDGTGLVGKHPGVTSANDVGGAVAFVVVNGAYAFAATEAQGSSSPL